MSVTATFCTCSDARNVVDKTFTQVTVKTCTIVYPCDVLHPTLKVLGGKIEANAVTGIFGRNYWITGQTLDNGVNYVSLAVDALSSWKNSIIGSSQFVTRSATGYNKALNDNLVIPNRPTTQVIACNGSAFSNSLATDRCYLLTMK